jgi:hypothetical protein
LMKCDFILDLVIVFCSLLIIATVLYIQDYDR